MVIISYIDVYSKVIRALISNKLVVSGGSASTKMGILKGNSDCLTDTPVAALGIEC